MAYPIYRAFSGTIAVLANVAIVLWTCWRLFRAIRFHRRCTADLVEFNKLVCQSSLSVDYIAAKVSETMEQVMMVRGLAAEIPGQIVSIGGWHEDVGRPEVPVDREDLLASSDSAYLDKRLSRLEGLAEEEKRAVVGTPEISLQPRFLARTPCTCESQYEIRDLGDGHYPRYLTASLCKPKACRNKFNGCRLLHYTVHVLRQRDSNVSSEDRYFDDGAASETPLPPSLRHNWRLQPVAVPVACISALEATTKN